MAEKKKLKKEIAIALLSRAVPLGEESKDDFYHALLKMRDRLRKLIKLANQERRTNPLFEIVARSEANRLGYEGGNPHIEIDSLGETWLVGLEEKAKPTVAELQEILDEPDLGTKKKLNMEQLDALLEKEKAEAETPKQPEKPDAPVPSRPPEETKPEATEEEKPKKRKQTVPKMDELRAMATELGVEIPAELGRKRKDIHAYLTQIKEGQESGAEITSDAEGEAEIESLLEDPSVLEEEPEQPKGQGMMKTAPAVSEVSVFDPEDEAAPNFGAEAEEGSNEILDEPEPEQMPDARGKLHDIAEDGDDVDLDSILGPEDEEGASEEGSEQPGIAEDNLDDILAESD